MPSSNAHSSAIHDSSANYVRTEPYITSDLFSSPYPSLHPSQAVSLASSSSGQETLIETSSDTTGISSDLDDYIFLRLLGSGGSGRVYHVMDNHTKKNYAMKVVNKEYIGQHRHAMIVDEKLTMEGLGDLPWGVVSLLTTMHDSENFYFLMYLYDNGTLENQVQARPLPVEHVRFYGAALANILNMLKTRNPAVLHRDIKLDNILIDWDGYPTLGDFGLSVTDGKQDTLTTDGAPLYMAPEVHRQEDQGFPSEVWSLGVVVYIMSCGRPPFGHKISEDEIVSSILNDELQFPDNIDATIKELLRFILVKDRVKRPTIEQVLQHTFFESINKELLKSGELLAPPLYIQPSISPTLPSHIHVHRGFRFSEGNDPYPSFTGACPYHCSWLNSAEMPYMDIPMLRGGRKRLGIMLEEVHRITWRLRHIYASRSIERPTPHGRLADIPKYCFRYQGWGLDGDHGHKVFELARMRRKGVLNRMGRFLHIARVGPAKTRKFVPSATYLNDA